MSARSYILAATLAASGAAVGFACGTAASPKQPAPTSTLPAAGSPRDDGTGLLARWSTATAEGGGDLSIGARPAREQGGAGYGGAQYGMYGGVLYGGKQIGGNRYGGSRYANYRFDASVTPTMPQTVIAPYEDYAPQTVTNGGTLTGVVSWPRPPRAPATLPAGGAGCDGELANPTLRIDGDGEPPLAVGGALVYLDGIARGRTGMPIGGVLERRACQMLPYIQIAAPIGTPLRITNADAAPVSLQLSPIDGGTARELELGGHGQTADARLDRAGIYRVDARAPGDGAPAYVVMPKHPYYVITDDHGGFRLDSVPPGSYTLVVWHAPVVTGVDANGAPRATKPFVARKTVKVSANDTTEVVVRLPAGR